MISFLRAMNPLDWLLAAVLVWSVLRAFMRGLVREAFALVGLIAGFLLACWNYPALAWHLRTFVTRPALADLVAFLTILLSVIVIATLLGKLLSRTASAVGLGFFDRLGGAVFGALRGTLFAIVVLLAVTVFVPTAAWVKTSTLAPYVLRANHAVSFVMPSEMKSRFVNQLELAHRSQAF